MIWVKLRTIGAGGSTVYDEWLVDGLGLKD